MIKMTKLADLLSYSEQLAVPLIAKELNGERERVFNVSKLVDGAPVSRGTVTSTNTKLEIAGLIETRSLGKAGTLIKVIEPEVFKQLVDLLS